MKFSKVQYWLAACVCLSMFSLAAVAGASDVSAVVQKACTKCHSSKRICLNLGVKSSDAWKTTVQNMVKKGAMIPSDSVEEAAMYLAKLDPGSAPICE